MVTMAFVGMHQLSATAHGLAHGHGSHQSTSHRNHSDVGVLAGGMAGPIISGNSDRHIPGSVGCTAMDHGCLAIVAVGQSLPAAPAKAMAVAPLIPMTSAGTDLDNGGPDPPDLRMLSVSRT